jgi:hypothetical protein
MGWAIFWTVFPETHLVTLTQNYKKSPLLQRVAWTEIAAWQPTYHTNRSRACGKVSHVKKLQLWQCIT